MTCTGASTLLAAFADGGLEGREHDDVAAHVRSCPGCAEEVRVLRETLGETRTLGAPAPRDEAFWQDLARGVRLAVDATPTRIPFWRLPALGFAFALAAAAIFLATARGLSVPAPAGLHLAHVAPTPAARPLPPSFEPDDLEGVSLEVVAEALGGIDGLDGDFLGASEAGSPPAPVQAADEDELAIASPASAEQLVETLDDDDVDLTRLAAAL